MAGKSTSVRVKNKKTTRGMKMTRGKGWRLVKYGVKKEFVGTLLETINMGSKRIAIFSVPK